MVMREVDENLALFLGIQNGSLVEESDAFDDSKSSGTFMVALAADDNFLNLEMEMEKSDNNWLLTQPDTSLLPSVEADVQDSATSQVKIANDEIISQKSELENTSEDASASLSESSAKLATSSGDRKPIHRAPTPIERPSLPAKPKSSRPSTPTLPSSKPVSAQSRSSNPVGLASRSSKPSSRPSIPIVAKSKPRSSTPTRKPNSSTVSASDRSLSGRKMGPEVSKSSGGSSTVKSRTSRPSGMLSLSQNAPQSLKTSMPKRPVSASRGRTSGPAARSSSLNEKPKRKSCSPPKVRAPTSAVPCKTGSKMLSRSRNGDDVNPVIMGTKMVDRVVNMRKLAPPKQDEYVSNDNPRKSSQENSGFGRSLSNKSLDMALRHMDIRRSIRDKQRTSVTGSCKSRAVGASESHLIS